MSKEHAGAIAVRNGFLGEKSGMRIQGPPPLRTQRWDKECPAISLIGPLQPLSLCCLICKKEIITSFTGLL